MKPEIFISHSAKDAVSADVLDRLYKTLKKANFEVLLDKERLKPGRDWRIEIFAWLKRCQCSIILVSRDALKSNWVLQEATILNWRSSLDRDFLLIPILLKPVTHKHLKSGRFSAVGIDRIQAITGSTAKDIVKEVRQRLREEMHMTQEKPMIIDEVEETVDQAAAICYRRKDKTIEFLLIRTRNEKNLERWIVPKGWIHPGEPLWLSALLDARKEGGVAGEIDRQPITVFSFIKGSRHLRIAAFRLKVEAQFDPDQTERQPAWYTLEEAKKKLAINRGSGKDRINLESLQNALEKTCSSLIP